MKRFRETAVIFTFLKGRLGLYLFTLLASASANASFNIIMAFVNKELINTAYSGKIQHLNQIVVPTFLAFTLICIIFPLLIYWKSWILRHTFAERKKEAFAHILKLEMSYFQENSTGSILSQLENDLDLAAKGAGSQMQVVAVSLIGGIGSAVAMAVLNIYLFLLTFLLGILSAYLNVRYADAFRKLNTMIRKHMARLTTVFLDNQSGMEEIKIFHLYRVRYQKYSQEAEVMRRTQFCLARKHARLGSMNYVLGAGNLLCVFLAGALMVSAGLTDYGEVMAIVTLQGSFSYMLLNLGTFYSQLQGSVACAGRIQELMKVPEEKEDRVSYKNVLRQNTYLSFSHVSFTYQNRKPILQNISFGVNRNQMLALVGASGSGKSTIVKLLLGYYPVAEGSIFLAGKPIESYTKRKLRSLFSYVPQEPVLFDGTIADNIRFGKLDATEVEIKNAAQLAYADRFIEKLPDGYETRTGESGALLSGGQRQRIAIARAVLRDAPIFIFDEATSALDNESQEEILKVVRELKKRKTVIMIAHRQRMVEDADVVVEVGKIN